jgi:arsenical pump membrane protein
MQTTSIIIILFLCSALATILLILLKPHITITIGNKKREIDSFFIPPLITAISLLVTGLLPLNQALIVLKGNEHLSPLGILILFLSMVFISIFLDSCGFFEYCARLAVRYAKGNGTKLFFSLYIVVSLLTIVTSNDIIILTFTPFIYYFTKATGAKPLPYLLAEFFAANTWSMALFVGNPTNIVIASAFSLGFGEYARIMLLPTIAAGLVNISLLYFIFRKDLHTTKNEKLDPQEAIKDKFGTIISLIVLASSIIFMSLAPYLHISLWTVAAVSAASLFIFIIIRLIYNYIKARRAGTHYENPILKSTLHKMPWTIVPFVLSLFLIVGALSTHGISETLGKHLATLLGNSAQHSIIFFGITSTIAANILNNIPMTVAFAGIITALPSSIAPAAAYATVIGSNLGANLTPIGALAGILWMTILKQHNFKVTFWTFCKYGFIITSAALAASLITLSIVMGAI